MREDCIKITKKYNGNPSWNIPGLFTADETWLIFLQTLQRKNIEAPFQYIYGTPYNTHTGGGRNLKITSNPQGIPEEQIIDAFFNVNVGCRLALSNHLLEEEDYKNDFRLLDILEHLNSLSTENGVILCDDKFNDFIQHKYPNLQRICSIIRPAVEVGWGNEDAEYYNELCKKYDIVVVSCGFAKDIDKINQLEQKDKIEVLVNTRCTLNCKLAKKHYDIVAEGYKIKIDNNKPFDTYKNIEKNNDKENELFRECAAIKKKDYFGGANFSIEEIQTLLDNGIHHFKLEGRNWPLSTVASDVRYYIGDDVILTRLYNNILGAII